MRLILVLAFMVGLAGCETLPRAFEGAPPPPGMADAAYLTGILVAPVQGVGDGAGEEPGQAAREAAQKIALALQRADLPAVAARPPSGSMLLTTELMDGALSWRLNDATGKTAGEGKIMPFAVTGPGFAAGMPKLAQAVDEAVLGLRPYMARTTIAPQEPSAPQEPAPMAPPPDSKDKPAKPAPPKAAPKPTAPPFLVAVELAQGAPGDGNRALAKAAEAFLGPHARLDPKGQWRIRCQVTVTDESEGRQFIRLRWSMTDPKGVEVGAVDQANRIPKGSLDGPWGRIAYDIALAASEGLLALIDQAAPKE